MGRRPIEPENRTFQVNTYPKAWVVEKLGGEAEARRIAEEAMIKAASTKPKSKPKETPVNAELPESCIVIGSEVIDSIKGTPNLQLYIQKHLSSFVELSGSEQAFKYLYRDYWNAISPLRHKYKDYGGFRSHLNAYINKNKKRYANESTANTKFERIHNDFSEALRN